MSVDYNIYLGPYVRCEVKPATREREVTTCPRVTCEGYTKKARGMFCSTCGSEFIKRMMVESYEPSLHDVLGDHIDDFRFLNGGYTHNDGEPYYFGCNLRQPPLGRAFNVERCVHLDISGLDPLKEMQWFEEAYADSILRLMQAYINVRIGWGLHVFDT